MMCGKTGHQNAVNVFSVGCGNILDSFFSIQNLPNESPFLFERMGRLAGRKTSQGHSSGSLKERFRWD